MSAELDLLRSVANVREADGPEFNINALIERGWFYYDFPKMLSSYWAYIKAGLGTVGVDYHLLTEASYGGKWMRGQLLCAPQSRQNLARYRETHPLPSEASHA